MDGHLFYYLTLWRPLGYTLIFVGALVEGDILLLASAAMTRLGYFDPFDMTLIIVSSVLIGDSLWFTLGSKFATSRNKVIVWLLHHVRRVPIDLNKDLFTKLLISKFVYGTQRATLVSLGSTGMSLRHFLVREIPAALIWIVVLGGIGYWFAGVLTVVRHYVRFFELGILVLVLTYLVFRMVMRRQYGKVPDEPV
jgi:membrane protein DedA with SNARE-associated domain